ncbi:MAG: GTPase HflX, partial [Bacteroidetes bacterium]|nr:GTPase HflX [Bacteroidota bacterium]
KLPHHLVASFKSTLDEVREADILLHVVDVSHPLFEEQMTVVNEILQELDAAGKPVLTVFNKIDRLTERSIVPYLSANHPDAVFVSATRGIHMSALRDRLIRLLDDRVIEQTLTFTAADSAHIARLHEVAEVLDTKYDGDTVTMRIRIPRIVADRLARQK